MPSPTAGTRTDPHRHGSQIDMFPTLLGGDMPDFGNVPVADIVLGSTDNALNLPVALRQSVERNGIIVPISLDSTYRIIDGRRRVALARELGIEEIPAMVFPHGAAGGDARARNAVIALTTNMVRSHNIIAELRAIEHLMTDTRATPDGIAERLGLSRRMVNNRLRLRNLRAPLRRMLESGRLSLGAALVLALRSTEQQTEIRERLTTEPAFRPTGAWLRSHFGIAEEDSQIPLLPADIEQGVGFTFAVALIGRLIQSIPEPETTDDPTHVEDIIFRLNHTAELIHAMTETA